MADHGSPVGVWGAFDILRGLQEDAGTVDMSMRMVRVLMNRLNQKDILGYTVDEHDSRVYHYYVQRSREECVKEKSRKFVDSYFSGSGTNAMAACCRASH